MSRARTVKPPLKTVSYAEELAALEASVKRAITKFEKQVPAAVIGFSFTRRLTPRSVDFDLKVMAIPR